MEEINKELIDPVVEPSSEAAHRLARASIGAIPAFGGALLEAFNALIEPPMVKRRTEWMIQVTDVLNQLLEKGVITEQDLQSNEKFFTTLVHASNVAIRNHEAEKLNALRNAVINSALPGAPDDTLQQLFLNIVDSFTSWHIALLKLFQNPKQWAQNCGHTFPKWAMGGLTSVIEDAYPSLKGQQDLYRLVWQELFRSGLVNTDGFGVTMSVDGMLSKRTTAIGDRFLSFISEPNFGT